MIVNPLTPLLLKEESLIKKLLKPDYRYLEWGCGRSTEVFSPLVNYTLSIEHDKKWGEYLIGKNLLNVKVIIAELGKDYLDAPNNHGLFDIILIDGRHRVECAYAVLDNNYLSANGFVIIHDWERLKYKEVLCRYDIIKETTGLDNTHKGLGILKPKQEIQL